MTREAKGSDNPGVHLGQVARLIVSPLPELVAVAEEGEKAHGVGRFRQNFQITQSEVERNGKLLSHKGFDHISPLDFPHDDAVQEPSRAGEFTRFRIDPLHRPHAGCQLPDGDPFQGQG